MKEQELKRIASRISKCLALAKSDNPGEAAAAKRQAHALMKKYCVTPEDIAAAQVCEKLSKSGGKHRAPVYIAWLAVAISKAFACEIILSSGRGWVESQVRFIGTGVKVELASYTFDVLLRQLKKDRKAYLSTLKRYKKSNKVRMANIFCEEWVASIKQQVMDFAGTEQEKNAIEAYKRQKYPDLTLDNREETQIKNNNDWQAVAKGQKAAKDVSLNRPVQTGRNTLLN